MPPTPAGGPRAHRTHARRSCDVCKLRKTRCELPDLDVLPSPTALPADKSCHRCRVLMLPCVVNDKSRKPPKPKGKQGSGSSTGSIAPPLITTSALSTRTTPAPRRNSRTSTGDTSPNNLSPGDGSSRRKRTRSLSFSRHGSRTADDQMSVVNPIDHTVDISSVFPLTFPTDNASPEPETQKPSQSLRFHGRPLSLLGEMLNVAATKSRVGTPRRVMVAEDLDFESLISPYMRTRLAGGFAQLRTFHPHLQRLVDMFSLNREFPGDISIQLLLVSSTYVALQSLPNDSEARALRADLAPSIVHLQSLVLAQQPTSFHAIQALEVLALHAPFAPALPFQLADPRTVAPARGLLGVARNISEQLNFNALVNSRVERWPNPDYWLWLTLRIGEAQMALEDERPRKPVLLGESRLSSAAMINPENEALWTSPISMEDPAELLGKLTICDRLARLDELHDCIGRLRSALENAATIVNFNGAVAVVEELQYYSHRVAAVDQRHDDVLSMLSLPSSLVSGWLSYRTMRRRWESMKSCFAAMQILAALHYLPGSIHAVSDLPIGLNTAQSVHYALTRAINPKDVLYAYSANSGAAEEMRRCSHLRSELAEQQLVSFLDISPALFPIHRGLANVGPVHEMVALTLESCKSLMELQASKIALATSMYGTSTPFTMPAWVPHLTQISHVFRKLALVRYEDEGTGFGEDITNSCSNLVGSMVRIIQEWMTALDSEASAPMSGLSLSHPSASSSMLPVQDNVRRSSTTSDMLINVETTLLTTVGPVYSQSYASSEGGWLTDENPNQARPMSARDMPSTISMMAHPQQPYPQGMEITPPPPPPALAPLMTVTPPSGTHMTPEDTPYPVSPPAPATTTATQTQHLDNLLTEMFGYRLAPQSPAPHSAPPMMGPGPGQPFPPPSPQQTISPEIPQGMQPPHLQLIPIPRPQQPQQPQPAQQQQQPHHQQQQHQQHLL